MRDRLGALVLAAVLSAVPMGHAATRGEATLGASSGPGAPRGGGEPVGLSAPSERVAVARVLAVVDTAVDTTHPAFGGLVIERRRALPRDGDGRCAAEDCCPPVAEAPSHFHGTAVLGSIVGAPDPVRGSGGSVKPTRVVAIEAFDGRVSDAARMGGGILCAIELGADLINVSLQGAPAATAPAPLAHALRTAEARGVLVVAAAGNGIGDLDAEPEWPASWNAPQMLTITAVDPKGRLTGQRFGRGTVDLAVVARQRDICTAWCCAPRAGPSRDACDDPDSATRRYGRFGQTSAAAALASAAALRVWAHPAYRDCDAATIAAALRDHAVPLEDARSASAIAPDGGRIDLAFLAHVGDTASAGCTDVDARN